MASISFFSRGSKPDKESSIWIKLRDRELDIRIPIPYLSCMPKDFVNGKCKNPSKKMLTSDVDTINTRLSKIEAEVLDRYKNDKPETNHKEWLSNVLCPSQQISDNSYTNIVVDFFDTYKNIKKDSAKYSTLQKVDGVKNLLIRFEEDRIKKKSSFRKLKFEDLDNVFRVDFETYCKEKEYNISTIYKNLKFLKMVCKVAKGFNITVNDSVFTWVFEVEKASQSKPKPIYLSLKELKLIKECVMPTDSLDNTRDWLLIACYTGQRVSDFLSFTKDLLIEDNEDVKFLEFTQEKTNTKMRIPVFKVVSEILDKRGGDFPFPISDQKFNQYVKRVCQIAGIDSVVYHGISKTVEVDGKKVRRKVFNDYYKYELISSHVGRRSFATNMYEKVPTTYILNVTGHTTEKQLLAYIGKSEQEKANSTAKVFRDLGFL